MSTTKPLRWQDLERIVRTTAETKFSATARAEDIAGVKCDCVIHLNDGSVVIVEISKEDTIDKLRQDINKFNTIRPYFFQQSIFPRCYFVTLEDPTPALIEAGRVAHVQVHSLLQFITFMLGVRNYAELRRTRAFGSAIDLYSGQPDDRRYVEVNYFTESGESYTKDRIASELIRGKNVVLIGDYGSGKSRCVKEVFDRLYSTQSSHYKNAIAIDLRDNWGLKRAPEIITRHFTDLGLGDHVSDVLKVAYSSASIYLLDGFDEIGAQTWSDDPTKLVEIRKQSLAGIKDLVDRAAGGVFITGREHYFNNDVELLTCLGLDAKDVVLLRCNQELSGQQFLELIDRPMTDLPHWIPKKPLIATIIRDIEPDIVKHIFGTSTGQIDFWELLLDTLCEREARINSILDASIIRALYTHIGRLSRTTTNSLGPISIKDINAAFEITTGRPPTDESAIILQRLPGLSRIGAESLDRQFVDSYILDGLKAEDILSIYLGASSAPLAFEWKHPVETFGAFYLATRLQSTNQVQAAAAYLKRHRGVTNHVLLSDLLAALFSCDDVSNVDLGGLELSKGRFCHLSFSACPVRNVRFYDCAFDSIDLTDADPIGISLVESTIGRVSGVTSKEHLPSWVSDCLFEDFQSVKTLTAIRAAGLTVAQTFLLSSLRKLFLQPGAGRKESSMYKGYGDLSTKKACEKVVALLLRERFCDKFKGATEALYIPNRAFTGRVKALMSQLTQSKDDLWTQTSRIV
jgi:hypothetical protein